MPRAPGRRHRIVYNVMRVANAVNPEPGIQYGFWSVIGIYALLTVIIIGVLRRMTRSTPVPYEPGDDDVKDFKVT